MSRGRAGEQALSGGSVACQVLSSKETAPLLVLLATTACGYVTLALSEEYGLHLPPTPPVRAYPHHQLEFQISLSSQSTVQKL